MLASRASCNRHQSKRSERTDENLVRDVAAGKAGLALRHLLLRAAARAASAEMLSLALGQQANLPALLMEAKGRIEVDTIARRPYWDEP